MVTVESGKIRGYVEDGIYVFRGIPYAKATRFMLPEKVERWDGVLDTRVYGECCPTPPIEAVFDPVELVIPHVYWPQNENCLFLNIWTPGIEDGRKRPVMVWLHGGGFSTGSSIEQKAYDGKNLSENGDVVVVSINHRLNVLGFLDLSAYGEKYRYSGNVGMADIVAALEWIKSNIEHFGGDPENITLFGQSGGGGKILTLMAMPAAKGLFQKAIVQSGLFSTFSPVLPQNISRRVAALTLENLGVSPTEVDDLQSIPYQTLLTAASKAQAQVAEETGQRVSWAPVLDGEYITVNVGMETSPLSRDVPVMLGTTFGEMDANLFAGFGKNSWSPEEIAARMADKYGDKAEAIAQAFRKAYPRKPLVDALFIDTTGRPATLAWARLKCQDPAPVYVYIFAYEIPVNGGMVAFHCAEIPFVFHNTDLVPMATGGGVDAFIMAEVVSRAWVNFARYGDPNHDLLPEWPAFTIKNGATMVFDKTSWVGYEHDDELYNLLSTK
ncbi:TPA: carboxylesterase [Candidatus Acetothermia bacterium]|nr:carboxylesterase [Candidatus Acetothermia bacterium]